MNGPHPTRLQIDLGAIRHNVRVIRGVVEPRAQVMAVVKANAYGHGAAAAAAAALEAGATWCATATLPEAVALRNAGIRAPIHVLGYTPATLADDAVAHDLRLTLYDIDVARTAAQVAASAGAALRVHVKIDSGMGRLGVFSDDARAFITQLRTLPGLHVEGAFTHFSTSESDAANTRAQIRRFTDATAGIDGLLRHACNSAGVFAHPEAHFDLVRPGLSMYGMSPFDLGDEPLTVRALRPALRWRTEIASVKMLPDGAPVGYNQRYRCVGERRIAVIPVGYGDGMRRTPQNAGEVLVRGHRAPIRGSVCMDQCMIDVTDVPDARIGDEVVLIGAQGDERITAEDVALRTGTVNYEVTTALAARPEREYFSS
ncbi:MAG: alanine racemase [Chloroflexi bacterium]|nr:alanine racemase [Chloroflexota bacterium]